MPRLALIRSAPPGAPGSMAAYADLVARALALDPPPGVRIGFCDAFDPRAGGDLWRQHFWRLRHFRGALRRASADAYHLLDGSMSAFLPRAVRERTWITVHDLIPVRQMRGALPGAQSLPARMIVRRGVRALRECRSVCADSEATRGDLMRLADVRAAAVIPPALRPLPPPAPMDESLPKRFVLHVGHNAPYKNRAGAIEVFRRLCERSDGSERGALHLVLAGPPPTLELRKRAAAAPRVVFLERVSDADLSALYRAAALLLFPSLYEGFGMPVLEAMSLGCPVVCSNAGALPEAAGAAALTAAADDLDALAGHCGAVLRDTALRERLVAAGRRRAAEFTLERMARQLWDWYGFPRGARPS